MTLINDPETYGFNNIDIQGDPRERKDFTGHLSDDVISDSLRKKMIDV